MNSPGYPPLETEARKRLRIALASALLPLRASAQQEVRAQVCTYVESLKAAGWPSEAVIVEITTLMREAGLQPDDMRMASVESAPKTLVPASSTTIVEDIVRWCMQRYYAPLSAPGSHEMELGLG